MADYNDRALRSQSAAGTATIDAGLRAYMLRVYNYMLVGLLLTGATAFAVAEIPSVRELFFALDPRTMRMGLSTLGWITTFAPLALVFFLSFRIQHMSLGAAQGLFWGLAALYGVVFAPIVLAYTGADIATSFFITAGTFGAMSLWGYTTRSDLTGFGSFLFMGLIGLLIASLVNIFLGSSMMSFVISVIGVLVFTGLTAYDTQKIKYMYAEGDDASTSGRKAVMGALTLYLDFINLFLYILRLLGSSRR
jgi:FtsH-binding integral membrane protein